METQEIRITAQITLKVPIRLSKERITSILNGKEIIIFPYGDNEGGSDLTFHSHLEIIEIEEEDEIYGTE